MTLFTWFFTDLCNLAKKGISYQDGRCNFSVHKIFVADKLYLLFILHVLIVYLLKFL